MQCLQCVERCKIENGQYPLTTLLVYFGTNKSKTCKLIFAVQLACPIYQSSAIASLALISDPATVKMSHRVRLSFLA